MNLKKWAFCLACTVFAVSNTAAWANSITKCEVEATEEILTVEGGLERAESGIAVNLLVEDENGGLKIIDMSKTAADGSYRFTVNLKERLAKGGKFKLRTAAQIEDAAEYRAEDGSSLLEIYLLSELNAIYTQLVENKQNVSENTRILTENAEALTYADSWLRKALAGGKAADIAEFISTEEITVDGMMKVLNRIGLIKAIEDADSQTIAKILTDSREALGITDNATLKKLNERYIGSLAARLAASDTKYNSQKAFETDVEDKTVVTEIYANKGTDGMAEVLSRYSEHFDLTVYNSSGNSKTAALKKLLLAAEENRIKTVSDAQSILNTKISSSNDSSSGKGSGSGGSGGGGGGGGSQSYGVGGGIGGVTPFDGNNVQSADEGFADLNDFEWARSSVEKLVRANIISGYSKTSFAPGEPLSRAQLCKIICGVFGVNTTGAVSGFADVADVEWYYPFVSALSGIDAVNGVDSSHFAPNENITRQDVCVMIYRMLDRDGIKLKKKTAALFDDAAEIDEYASEAVSALANAEIIVGFEGKFAPKSTITRAEAAVLMYRVYEIRNGGLN